MWWTMGKPNRKKWSLAKCQLNVIWMARTQFILTRIHSPALFFFTPLHLGEKIHRKTTGRDMKKHELSIWSITNYPSHFFCCCRRRRTLEISITFACVLFICSPASTRYDLLILVRVSCVVWSIHHTYINGRKSPSQWVKQTNHTFRYCTETTMHIWTLDNLYTISKKDRNKLIATAARATAKKFMEKENKLSKRKSASVVNLWKK